MAERTVRGDLRRLNAFGASWMGVLVMPVYVPFLLSRGFHTGEVLDLQAIYSIAVMLFEIPTGMLCDLLGRRRVILGGAVLNVVGFAGFATANGFVEYGAVQLVLAAGWSLVSGSDVALIYDVLDRNGADRDARRRALGNYALAQVSGEAVASLAGGVVAGWSLRALGWATAAETLLPLLLAIGLPAGMRRPDAAIMMVSAIPRACREVFGTVMPRLLFANWVILGTFDLHRRLAAAALLAGAGSGDPVVRTALGGHAGHGGSDEPDCALAGAGGG